MSIVKHKLTERQRRFVDAYLEFGSARKAATAAGFKVSYAQAAKRQPAVQAYLEERRKQMPVQCAEALNFLAAVMRGNLKASDLQTEAAYQMGVRAGLWKNTVEAKTKIEEAARHE